MNTKAPRGRTLSDFKCLKEIWTMVHDGFNICHVGAVNYRLCRFNCHLRRVAAFALSLSEALATDFRGGGGRGSVFSMASAPPCVVVGAAASFKWDSDSVPLQSGMRRAVDLAGL